MEEVEWKVSVWEAEWRVVELGELGELEELEQQVLPKALSLQTGLVFAALVLKIIRGDERPLEVMRMIAVDI